MTLSERELDVVTAVLDDLLRKPYGELNTFIGSETIKDMAELYGKLRHRHYCERHGIAYEDMDEFDFEREYSEEWEV